MKIYQRQSYCFIIRILAVDLCGNDYQQIKVSEYRLLLLHGRLNVYIINGL